MKITRRMLAAVLACLLLLTVGCGTVPENSQQPEQGAVQVEDHQTEQVTEQATEQDDSLDFISQIMSGSSYLFAVAYFGYHETIDSDLPVDPYEAMLTEAPQLCESMPFLLEIPAERVIGETGDLFCVVPLEENAVVAVSIALCIAGAGEDDVLGRNDNSQLTAHA